MPRRKMVMDKASERINKIHLRVNGTKTKAELLHAKLCVLAELVDDSLEIVSDFKELMDELENLSTLTHKTNWRVLAEADGVELPDAE